LKGARAFGLRQVPFWFATNMIAFLALLSIHFGTAVNGLRWWPDAFAVAINLLAGGIVSFLFFYLVVHYPEQRRKSIIKRNLLKMYRSIKKDILWNVVFASQKGGRHDLVASVGQVDKLMNPEAFKKTFGQGREANEGFYAFQNQMHEDTPEFMSIIRNIKLLSRQIEFVLYKYDIEDQQQFELIKRLEFFLLSLQEARPGYDESKELCRFIWDIFAGWDSINGYVGYDRIERLIEDI